MHPALQPYVDPKPVRIWRYVLAGALIGLLGSRIAIELAVRRAGYTTCRESIEDIARATTRKLAFEAYPMWRITSWSGATWSGATCPESLDELLPFMNNRDTLDPWGTHYRFWCSRSADRDPALHVLSAGPDRELGTDDDLGSDP
jgi:hypothetical protein